MPINKNAQLRYQILDRCFSNFNRKYTIDDLMDEVNDKLYDLNGTTVKVRQLWQDMENMTYRPYNAPIKSYAQGFGKKHYYRYEDPEYSIFKSSLSEEEVSNLRSTIDMLSRYRGIPSNAWLEEVISNLEYRFGIKSNSDNVIEFDQNEQLKGLEYLSDLIDATVNHQPLKITYRSYKGKELTTIVHPYYIKQYNNRWFLFGLEINKKYGNNITNKAPRVYIESPSNLKLAAGATKLPHTYDTKKQWLCLYYPKYREWNRSMKVSETIVHWAILWMVYYEAWLCTGIWQGDGHGNWNAVKSDKTQEK